mmetsp:Transcript_12763/g.19280  ORF Transcript_12763/g.19280 Transcript_12763/m.19280 type:complete len:327 (+) Transcript_12763:140-1120(+)|eukprot:CAMPEP_0196816756 /NCGR_PEP_ID=MMETSP1362-20130617/56920_1 /TAXON_ID=163516 /ORGANISM="Leptocylindrus danicus, Strain CCMP1856" /LENGTH=326 /DNA_ID=CAMNT_0042194205 /DNA_START=120 /DNA_END=1100 /DNA_ORIENTATION=+
MVKSTGMSLRNALGVCLIMSSCLTSRLQHVHAFSVVNTARHAGIIITNSGRDSTCSSSTTAIHSSLNGNDNDNYSRELRLREEAESPFRKVRQFFTIALLGGAMTSLAVSSARILAAMNGVNTDLMQESIVNAGVDVIGVAGLVFLYKRDMEAQESRLKRAAKGAEFAKLMIRGTFGDMNGKSIVTSLSTLRRGRGLEKRAVIAAAGKDKITTVLQEAAALSDSLSLNDLVIVPVVMPSCSAPLGLDMELIQQENIALPAGGNWVSVIMDEAAQAKEQNIDVEKEGFCVVLKKNGRVGQRTKGINLARMCGEVEERQALGMDVKNI